ncbi:uncharacterized protein GGS25DRAFT_498190 [Hypoxylon fragiforme]|uniref:uncharacterized protein n=1 Tax=Hypoxylon fragiforme TaxID=63214 RepID=UPI0020C6B639|nr:uncharacterized protein GGS25DRAFT_498190 [Hypoxylon fragiforme]KAI2605820.1 hypothetical protein GGS25DRAFT_498190 [Hypoxylon fragiforme]
MSLGITSLGRAPSYTARVKGLSLFPREQQYKPSIFQLSQLSNSRQWLSTSTRKMETSPTISRRDRIISQLLRGKSRSALFRAVQGQVIKKKLGSVPNEPILVKLPVQYPNKYKSIASFRRFRRSVARQYLHDDRHEAAARMPNTWRSTLDFMLRHTHKVGAELFFRIIIGKGRAAEAYAALSVPDTRLSEIGRRNECLIQFEQSHSQNGELSLSVAGPEKSVRKSIIEIIDIVGKITAIRLIDPKWKPFLSGLMTAVTVKQSSIRRLGDREAAEDNNTLTLIGPPSTAPERMYKSYTLSKRADEIEQPTIWTRISFEEYVAALVQAEVPTHVARALYPNFPDHQATVVSLLVNLFTSEETKSAISMSALKMAIKYIESKGSGFRQASRIIFSQVELLEIPMDAEIFGIFLASASRARDLGGFNSIIRSMVKKGFSPDGRAWVAFIEMIEHVEVKRFVSARLGAKGLRRNPSILRAVGRQMAVPNLEYQPSLVEHIEGYLLHQTKKYGVGWLDTITLNKLVANLGARDEWKACDDLLRVVYASRMASPNAATLNTLLTHTMSLEDKVALMGTMPTRFPGWASELVPNDITYHLLYRAAWLRRYPNTVGVVWRYAVLARQTNGGMRRALSRILEPGPKLGGRRAFMKMCENMIFGEADLAEVRASRGLADATDMIRHYTEKAKGMRPGVWLADKLQEALGMDATIHRTQKNGEVLTTEAMRLLTVKILLTTEEEYRASYSIFRKT